MLIVVVVALPLCYHTQMLHADELEIISDSFDNLKHVNGSIEIYWNRTYAQAIDFCFVILC